MKKVLIILASILVIIIGVVIGGLYYIDSKIYVSSKKENKHNIAQKFSVFQNLINSVSNQDGVDNIVLAGTDARSKETASRTDSIMMATIDRTNKEVKLTSFMRDMFVPIAGCSKNYKINTAFFLGGPERLIQTLNENFRTNAEYYVTIDFSAFQALVNKFNGIDIDVKPYEVKEMNKYIKEENWHDPDFITTSGMQHLNGQQVLSYCRIRHVGNNDYERTERQRRVLTLLIQKVRKENIFQLPGLLNTVLPYIKTNIPSSKLLAFGISAYKFSKSPVSTLRIPADGMYSSQVIGGQDVLVPDFQQNIDLLSKFIASSNSEQNKTDISTPRSASNIKPEQALNKSETNTKSSNEITNTVVPPQKNNDEINSNMPVAKSNIDIRILNSTGRSGLAAEYKTKLEALGYSVTQIDNYKYKIYSETIINDYSKQGYGDILSHDLKFGNVIKKRKAKPLASIIIILGSDSENKLSSL